MYSANPRSLQVGDNCVFSNLVGDVKLAAHSWDVINFDRVPSPDLQSGAFYEVNVELTDIGQVLEALQEVDMVRR